MKNFRKAGHKIDITLKIFVLCFLVYFISYAHMK